MSHQLGLFGPPPNHIADPTKMVPVRAHTRLLHNGTRTSREAAVENRERRPSQREQVLKAIGEAREGLTNEEMSKRTGIPIQSICARRNELVRDGLIENRPGEMRTTKSGAKATVWRVK